MVIFREPFVVASYVMRPTMIKRLQRPFSAEQSKDHAEQADVSGSHGGPSVECRGFNLTHDGERGIPPGGNQMDVNTSTTTYVRQAE